MGDGRYSFFEEASIMQQLDHIAKEKGSNRSALIRQAIREFLKREKAGEAQR